MGSNVNFKNFVIEPAAEANGLGDRPPGNLPLTRQPSIYSLTFDEFLSTMGSVGKDFGSMNMDELLKNIWTAEETQTLASAVGPEGGISGGYLQRQGSLTLPRTLSQKTVDEVWRDMSKEYIGTKDGTGNSGSNLPQRQQTLGEITLEEFLVRAGVVREDTNLTGKPNANGGFYNNTNGMTIGFQQINQNNALMSNRIPESNGQISYQSPNLPLNVNGVRSSQQQQQQPPPPQQLYPKPATTVAYAPAMALPGNPQMGNLVQGAGMGMVGLGPAAVTVATGSPASDGMVKSNGDTSSVSPVPYVFNGGLRGRKCSGAVEKVVERRQRRMIKNRESAARSRARKQAYTMELEAEVAKLKEENEQLQKKQAEIMEMQKNQVLEMMNLQRDVKRRCLRRTQTGPW